ncbi:hypothetical protein QIS99_29550 [Streptomyces sp. B-S-A8]|uniref:DUF2568 domain-containing protein n=1 Tax=Streptomyces solicavernae TaxID=3043614 RepID=A0ABT6S0X0_9ACTN|nr:hypothetical protein [Streptomyces sp. B-S-A8]MDI3390307.1 hypothetical protein [Streptomyces sp. B-S-A8]
MTPGPEPATTGLRLVYAAAGLLIGGAWAYGRDMPLWEHALRLCVIVVVVPPVLHLVRSRLRRRSAAQHLPLRQLVVTKVLLVAAAVVVELLLDPLTAWASFVTAAALAAVVAVGGPAWHQKQRSPSHG